MSKLWGYLHLTTSLWLLLAAVLQAVTVVVLARGLSIIGFGTYMTLQATVQIAAEFAALGSGHAYIRRVSRSSEQHSLALGHALTLFLMLGPVAALGAYFAQHYVLSIATTLPLVWFLCAELFGMRISTLCEHVCVANRDVHAANLVRICMAGARLIALVATTLVGRVDLLTWVAIQGAVSVVTSGLLCARLSITKYGRPTMGLLREDLGFGALSFLLQLASTLQANVDRLLLASFTGASTVARYSSATRVTMLGSIPIQGVLRNLIANAFREGLRGPAAATAYAFVNLPRLLTLGVLVSVGLCLVSPLTPLLFGHEYTDAVFLVVALSLLPGLQGVGNLLSDALSASDRQALRAVVATINTVLFCAIVGLSIKKFGITGLVVALYVYQVLSIVLTAVILTFVRRG